MQAPDEGIDTAMSDLAPLNLVNAILAEMNNAIRLIKAESAAALDMMGEFLNSLDSGVWFPPYDYHNDSKTPPGDACSPCAACAKRNQRRSVVYRFFDLNSMAERDETITFIKKYSQFLYENRGGSFTIRKCHCQYRRVDHC
jgi:hypothetical protein